MELDDEVELTEEFEPSDLTTGEQLSGREVLNIFMICYHVNWGQRSLEVMTSNFEGFKNGKQFLVMDIVVEFGWGNGLRVKGNWMDFTIGGRYSRKDSCQGIV